MIRKLTEADLSAVMDIWLETNIKAHSFIAEKYWQDNFEMVKSVLPEAEVYVYKENGGELKGFIGLIDNYIAGLFVKSNAQSYGIGKKLLDYVKTFRTELTLTVYEKNIRAVSFYQREQFATDSEKNRWLHRRKRVFYGLERRQCSVNSDLTESVWYAIL